MKLHSLCTGLVLLTPIAMLAADKPRIYVTESQAAHLTGDAASGELKGSLKFTGGTSPQNIEVMRTFADRCPSVIVTSDREKADFTVRLDHEAPSPVTPFTRGNKVAVFNKNSDLIYSSSTRVLNSAVKGACTAIAGAK